jgi:hypothetical protein
MHHSYFQNDYATRHTLIANTLLILPSIDKACMHTLLSLRNLVELINANTILRSHNGYWSEDKSSDVPPIATNVDI